MVATVRKGEVRRAAVPVFSGPESGHANSARTAAPTPPDLASRRMAATTDGAIRTRRA